MSSLAVLRRGASASRLAVALCCLLVANATAFAQGTRGTINGTVTDPSGAVIQGASVQVERVDTGQVVRTVQTNEEGVYQVLEIEPGTYNVVIQASGFAEARLVEVKVEPNRNVRLDAALNVTGSVETVEVTAGTELIEKDSATLGTTVDRQRVQGLPLNGRNVLTLALLQPGVLPGAAGFGQGTGFSVNGSRPVENNITLDGANNNEVATGGTIGAQPRPDAVQEFRLLTSNYDAEFGRNSGAIVNVVTRSGTNEFHGNARIFYRPTFLSAARFFDKANATEEQVEMADGDLRRKFERKEFGGNLGGPIWIPKLYDGRDRTFFFVDYEGRRQLIGTSATLTRLPTAAERLGDFSQLGRNIIDPATGQQFPGNRIPMDRFSPIALYYLQFLPTGDENGVAVVSGDDITNFDEITARFDHYISQDQTINYTLNYFDQASENAFAFGGSSVPGFGSTDTSTSQNHVIRHTYTFSPTLINSLLVAYTRNNFPGVVPTSRVSPREIGFTGNFIIEESLAGAPQVRLFDRGVTIGNSIQGPQTRVPENFQIQDSVSWAWNEHRFKFGFDGTLYRQDQEFLFINQGIFTFSRTVGGNTTGDDLADFLIGNSPAAIQTGSNGERDFRQKYVAAFAQDTWRVRDDLTLSLGVRYEYTSPITDLRNRVSYYRPGQTSVLLETGAIQLPGGATIQIPEGGRAPNGLVYVGDPDPVLGGTVPEGGVRKDYNNFAPRFGIAYSPYAEDGIWRTILGDRETAIRAGFGVYYGYIIGDTALQSLSTPGFDSTGAFFVPGSGTLADPFAPDPFPNFRGDQGQLPNPFARSAIFVSAPLTNTAQPIDPNIRTPYTYQWNLTIERGFLDNYVATVSYVGTQGRKLYVREELNPALGTFFAPPPGRTIPTPTTGNANSRRLNDDIRASIQQLTSAGRSHYHALEAQLQRRFSNGLTFQAAYTFSKNISDADSQRGGIDLLDRDIGLTLSSIDAPHRFVGNFLWELPYWQNTSGWVNRVAHGWGVGAIATFQSGSPFSVGTVFDTIGTSGVFSAADLGAPYVQFDPRENDGRAFNPDAFVDFSDPADGFVLATDFRRGTAGFNQYRLNNGINNWDLIVSKKTQLWSETSNLELRFEAFNAFNHAQFTTVDLNLANIRYLDDAETQIDLENTTFGKYTGTREARVIQLAARISF